MKKYSNLESPGKHSIIGYDINPNGMYVLPKLWLHAHWYRIKETPSGEDIYVYITSALHTPFTSGTNHPRGSLGIL